ncbi:Superfamily I DNA or RNA helicase [Amycolatopsis arida]|uniref:DNA 3'-5' helicase n=1 Tax=Amycolatopsis arida TaxID=587909 RepID=A0A1I5WCC3_9PSEU|nr:ATP-dependent DNA helicase [Amycolatopsis arida]TDX92213.1 superfamily I DNA/RNA helicase [Amycolatopsis arida]SFQ17359.1 Superfamily I DNA or RNA helicase [Amycolatopsis arida]
MSTARLVRPAPPPPEEREWDEAAHHLLDGPAGFTRVLGGPGTGKTTLLADTATQRIRAASADHVLVLTASRKAADAFRARITHQLTKGDQPGHTVREPIVRTVHSYAFAVLRLQAQAHELPPPRLLSGPEQDVVVRELLAGDLEDGAPDWPERLRPALLVPGFAEELRDLLLRAAERGLGPEDLVKLGRDHARDEWVSAGIFWRQYEEVTLLQGAGGNALGLPGPPALDAAELVASALVALESDPDLLAREQARIRHLLVDDAQHLDPLQYRLVRRLGSGAADLVLAGDPDQAIFSFRGADPRLLADADPDATRTITLTRAHRLAPAVHTAVGRLAGHLTGLARHRETTPTRDTGGRVRTRLLPTPAAEASWIADQLRRAHLIDEIPWSEMAVLVRSPARSFPVLQRALRAAGVPIATADDELPLARQPGVRPLLAVLRVAADPDLLDADLAESLLSSPLGGADPLALRRLRRGLRRLELAAGGERSSDDLLVEALRHGDVLAGLAEAEAAPVRRVGALIARARAGIRRGAGVEQVLWELWQGSGLEPRWTRLAARGGSLGAQADRDLDAVVALFHAAGRYVDRLPRASVAGFADYLAAQQIAGDTLAPTAARADGVALLTAHAAAGREWTVVAVAGVQEGSWPDLRLRGSLLGVERLVDLLAGVAGSDSAGVSMTAPLLAEERRLFYVAASRTRRVLLVSAVQGEDEQPSRFLSEHRVDESEEDTKPRVRRAERSLVLSELVGELRTVVCDGTADAARRRLAARQLAKLADAGVPGAHPDSWYGLAEVSTDEPLHRPDDTIAVSPSTVDTLAKCPLRWLLERHGGSDPAQLAAVTGTLVHALAQAAASGADDAQLQAALDEAWSRVDAGAPWFSRRERRRVEQMVRNFLAWLRTSRGQLTQLAVERDMEVPLPTAEGEPEVTLRGRVDRLEVDAEGRPVVVDIKTSKSAISAADAEQHPQLATYQLAALLGAFAETGREPGGAKLVYVAKAHHRSGAAEREQLALDADGGEHWLDLVRRAALSTTGPRYTARENPDCERCPGRFACPLRPEGRQVTGP